MPVPRVRRVRVVVRARRHAVQLGLVRAAHETVRARRRRAVRRVRRRLPRPVPAQVSPLRARRGLGHEARLARRLRRRADHAGQVVHASLGREQRPIGRGGRRVVRARGVGLAADVAAVLEQHEVLHGVAAQVLHA